MADPRFFSTEGPFSLSHLATIAGAQIGGGANPEQTFVGVAPLSDATAGHISFLDNRKYADAFTASRAGASLVHPTLVDRAPAGMALLITETPYHAYARVADAFHKPIPMLAPHGDQSAVHPSAEISEGARLGTGVVIAAGVKIGAGTTIDPNTVIGPGCEIGDRCRIGANVTLQCCLIGADVIIHPGVRIGQDGFGFAMGPKGHLKVPQLGRVVIEDNVEIGANTAVDRGTGPDTVIGAGTKIDNLVQIAHNVRLGKCCVIVSQVGISGSTELGDFVVAGGQVGFAGHLKIGSGAQIAAQSGVMRDIEPGAKMGGSPAQPMKSWLRGVATLEKMAQKS